MSRVLITGSSGGIGTVLSNGLEHQITGFDLPENDARDKAQLVNAARGNDAIIHLAWDTNTDNWKSSRFHLESIVMAENAYAAAIQSNVTRIIVASSVHADHYIGTHPKDLLNPYSMPQPDNPYGVEKCMIETLGRYYAKKGLEVVCLRFGGINPENNPCFYNDIGFSTSWLSYNDCLSLVDKCLTADRVPEKFAIIYAVSNNTGRIHDTINPFGWMPNDNAETFMKS